MLVTMTTRTRLSLEEFLALPDIDERRLELLDGEVYEKVSPRWGHSRIALRIGAMFDAIGYAGVEPRAVIGESANRAGSSVLPDVAFYRTNPPADDDWMRTPPDIAVEVLSRGQNRAVMRAKVDTYLAFGVHSVWVVDLERGLIEIYEGDERHTLTGDDVVETRWAPGFRATVAELLAPR